MVSKLLSSPGGSGGDSSTAAPLKTYTETFNEIFPQYLSIGMTEEQYWDGDCQLVVAFRKADEIRMKRKNMELWLQGLYFYDALCRVSPILHVFAKKGTKAEPYPSEPYALTNEQKENKEEKQAKSVFEKGKRFMESFMMKNNKKFERE